MGVLRLELLMVRPDEREMPPETGFCERIFLRAFAANRIEAEAAGTYLGADFWPVVLFQRPFVLQLTDFNQPFLGWFNHH